MQVAESIARTQKVVVIDCEQSSKQFQKHYTNDDTGSTHYFLANLYHAEVDSELLDTVDQDQAILESVEQAAKEGFKVTVIDNISFICVDTEKAQTSIEFMRKLIKLKKRYGLTILVVAHTPKRDASRPLTQNDLSGSSKLMALIDAATAIGTSSQDPKLRYAKTVKFRSGEYPCPADHVAIYKLEKVDNYTHLVFQDYGNEADHLREKTPSQSWRICRNSSTSNTRACPSKRLPKRPVSPRLQSTASSKSRQYGPCAHFYGRSCPSSRAVPFHQGDGPGGTSGTQPPFIVQR